eukprot:1191868-Prorocentrum_minimum.AAC.2
MFSEETELTNGFKVVADSPRALSTRTMSPFTSTQGWPWVEDLKLCAKGGATTTRSLDVQPWNSGSKLLSAVSMHTWTCEMRFRRRKVITKAAHWITHRLTS